MQGVHMSETEAVCIYIKLRIATLTVLFAGRGAPMRGISTHILTLILLVDIILQDAVDAEHPCVVEEDADEACEMYPPFLIVLCG